MTPSSALRAVALALPGTSEGIACEGTAIEKRTIKVARKAFLFLGAKDAMVKLDRSQPEARQTSGVRVGANGWATVPWTADVPVDTLKRWVEESYRLLAPRDG